MFFKPVDGLGKSEQVSLFGVPSLALTSCKSLLFFVRMTLLNNEQEERRKRERERRVTGSWHIETHYLNFCCETFLFSYYLSTRNCLFLYIYIYVYFRSFSCSILI